MRYPRQCVYTLVLFLLAAVLQSQTASNAQEHIIEKPTDKTLEEVRARYEQSLVEGKLDDEEIWGGFRGIRWGTRIQEIGEMEKIPFLKFHYDVYRRRSDKRTIGAAQLSDIGYSFYEGRFFGVWLRFKGDSNFEALKEALTFRYGTPEKVKGEVSTYEWKHEPANPYQGVKIRLEKVLFVGEGKCFISHRGAMLLIETKKSLENAKASSTDF